MNISRAWKIAAFAGVIAAGMLPWIGKLLRRDSNARCDLDGAVIGSVIRVRIMRQKEGEWSFCSILCAEKWLQASRTQPDRILVTDEATGTELDAGEAFFVRSQIIAHGPTLDRRHVFSTLEAAESHAASHRGRILEGNERPFTIWLDRQSAPSARK